MKITTADMLFDVNDETVKRPIKEFMEWFEL